MPSPSLNLVTGRARGAALRDSPPDPEPAKADPDRPGQRSGSRSQLESLRRVIAAPQTRTVGRPPRNPS